MSDIDICEQCDYMKTEMRRAKTRGIPGQKQYHKICSCLLTGNVVQSIRSACGQADPKGSGRPKMKTTAQETNPEPKQIKLF